VARLVEIATLRFPCRASAASVVATARTLPNVDVEVRSGSDIGDGVIVIVSALASERLAGEHLERLALVARGRAAA